MDNNNALKLVVSPNANRFKKVGSGTQLLEHIRFERPTTLQLIEARSPVGNRIHERGAGNGQQHNAGTSFEQDYSYNPPSPYCVRRSQRLVNKFSTVKTKAPLPKSRFHSQFIQ